MHDEHASHEGASDARPLAALSTVFVTRPRSSFGVARNMAATIEALVAGENSALAPMAIATIGGGSAPAATTKARTTLALKTRASDDLSP